MVVGGGSPSRDLAENTTKKDCQNSPNSQNKEAHNMIVIDIVALVLLSKVVYNYIKSHLDR